MTGSDIKRLALILSIQARIEGMKATNESRKQNKESLAYSEEDFLLESIELENVAYKHDEQL